MAVEDEPEVRWTSKTTQAVACTLLCGIVALTATQRAEPNLIPTPRFGSRAPTQEGEAEKTQRYLRFTQSKDKPYVALEKGRELIETMYAALAEDAELERTTPDIGVGSMGKVWAAYTRASDVDAIMEACGGTAMMVTTEGTVIQWDVERILLSGKDEADPSVGLCTLVCKVSTVYH